MVKDLDQLSRAIFAVSPTDFQQLALYQNALRLLAVMTDNRNERLDSSDGSMPWILWFVLIVGGLITLGYPGLFRLDKQSGGQVLMTAALAELVALAMLLGLAFDYPFTGDARISARALRPGFAPDAADLAAALIDATASRLFRRLAFYTQ